MGFHIYNEHTWEFSCSCAIDVHHWDGDDLEFLQLISHFHKLRSSLDYHELIPCTCQSMYPLGDDHNFF